jgi:tetratricopeptide (TPR) repeat protein
MARQDWSDTPLVARVFVMTLDLLMTTPASCSLIPADISKFSPVLRRNMQARLAIIGTIGLFVAACGAGTPQNEAVRSEAVLSLGTLSTTSKVARQEIADGAREFDMNRPEEAYVHMQRAIAADPNFAMAELWAYISAQSQKDAVDHLNRAVALAPKASKSEQLQIQAEKKAFDGDDSGSVALMEQAATQSANDPRLWTNLGFRLLNIGEEQKAPAVIEKAIAAGPNFEPAYILESVVYTLATPYDFKKAEDAARKAVALEPNESDPHDYLGDALRAQGKLEEAGAEYTKCAELDPTRGGCLQQRGHVNTFLGKYPEARADYDAAVALSTGNAKPTLAAYRSFVYLFEGNPKGAIDELNKLYDSIDAMNIPEPAGTKQQVDSFVMAIAEHNGLIKDAEHAVARRATVRAALIKTFNDPNITRGAKAVEALDMGFLAVAKGDYATATAKANEYMQLRAPDTSPNKNRHAHDLMGLIAVKQKHFADAAKHFAEGNPDHIYMNYWNAVALESSGHQPEAQQLYKKIANYYFNAVGVGMVRMNALAKVKGATA